MAGDCKNRCTEFKLKGGKLRYINGEKFCRKCNGWFKNDQTHCFCCGYMYRIKARCDRLKGRVVA